jgi:hypothetical protein
VIKLGLTKFLNAFGKLFGRPNLAQRNTDHGSGFRTRQQKPPADFPGAVGAILTRTEGLPIGRG